VPVVHVEAGLRSYNRAMPEEINRVVADHLSDLLLCPSQTAIDNLGKEGITRGVSLVGDVMLDVINWARQRADRSTTIDRLQLTPGKYLLLTMHRAENTDNPDRLAGIVQALNCITEPIVFPVHPRARKMLASGPVKLRSSVHMIDPVGYLEMVALTGSARLVLTDSGGLQKEAYWLGVPCVTLRDETEWVETVDAGWNVLVGANRDAILETVRTFSPPAAHPPQYGDGFASVKCVDQLDTLQ
jgi:UDP-N-acetylglucosamine 2-epimerase